MISSSGFLANFHAGYKLSRNIPKSAESSHPEMAKTVKADITGCDVRMIMQIMVPKETPTPKLASKTIRL